MTTINKVCVAGLGAIGSAYAARFFEKDPGLVSAIVDRERLERYVRLGVSVNGKVYPFHLVTPETADGAADLIMIAVKHHHLAECVREIRPFVGRQTIVLSLLNGITSEELVGKEFGPEKVLYSFVIGTDAVREGTSTRYSRLGQIVFGERTNLTHSPKVAPVKELFDHVGIPYRIPDDMLRELWWKFMMNVGINQMSAVLRATYGVFSTVSEARELMEAACREVLRIGEKVGISLREDDIQEYLRVIATLSPEGKTSMLQDVEAGRKTEVEIFAGTVSELGRRYGLETPLNDCLLRMIHVLEQTYPGTGVSSSDPTEL